jgi:predicted dehydrogenase
VANKALPLKIAIVGCGALAQRYYCPALGQLAQDGLFKVAALVDPVAERRDALHKHFTEAALLQDINQLSDLGIDLAIVATPPHCHATQSISLLNSGISVLCEKPMATSLIDANAMIEAASHSTAILAIGLIHRFWPAVQVIHQVLCLGILGAVESVTMTRGGSPSLVTDWRYRKSLAGGGIMMEVGIHQIDEIIWWLGYPQEIIYGDDALGGVESNCQLHMKFGSGAIGNLRLSRDINLPLHRLIKCSNGWLETSETPDNLTIGFNRCQYALRGTVRAANLPLQGTAANARPFTVLQTYIEQLRNVARAILGFEELLVSGQEGIKSLQLIESCYRQRTLVSMPWFSQEELARAHQLSQPD